MDVAHVLDDGGGRELAYVAMSRARHASHVYTVGGDLRDAAERLTWSWDQERREKWVTDRHRAAERIEALQAEWRQLFVTIPPDVSAQLARVRKDQAAIERDLADLGTGAGRWRTTPVGDAHYQLLRAQSAYHAALRRASARRQGTFGRRRACQDVDASVATVEESERALRLASEPQARGLFEQQARLAQEVRQLEGRQQARAAFLAANPQVMDRIAELSRAVESERAADRRRRTAAGGAGRPLAPRRSAAAAYEPPDALAPSHPYGPDL